MTTLPIRVICIGELKEHFPFSESFMKDSEVRTVSSTLEADEILKVDKDFAVIFCALENPKESIGFFDRIKKEIPDIFRFLASEKGDSALLTDAINKGKVYHFFRKPWKVDELEMYIRQAHYKWALKRENFQLVVKLIDTNKRLEAMLLESLKKKKTKVNWDPTL